ncbi:GTPase Era [Roseivivax jejudonensis]|uniref:GTPase Era n=1 Tax=Roseivivax jejudonensis TaxID=1529041 RepID=A0A1X6Y4C8_9RHOB|nr:dynamin family protein [Roseivivax jejudonensis]SLN10149.1 GTPase Era [Roseivivax jejudonensis]
MQHVTDDFADKIRAYYGDPLDPLSQQFMFRRPPTIGELRRPPQVLLLGNHSSGKSTFINYLLGSEVQKTGVAPTDDSFTIITWGADRADRDGPAVVSNPDLPYEGLRHFGDQLVSHIRLKQRQADLLRTVTLIDSPGMIDEAKAEGGRGYDFPGAVRWFAERADLVIVFFDPDKPGTTGETLQVFKEALSGIDHKLLIVMNKMDQFQNLHDFARAYGALCWNLGKVTLRKDLPLIYNTFVPIAGKPASKLPVDDFDEARRGLVEELRSAPTRRLDNLITQMQTFTERLRLHAFVIDGAARKFRRIRTQWRCALLGILVAASAASVATGMLIALPGVLAVIMILTLVVELGILPRERKRLVARFDDVFERIYERELLMRDRDMDLRALWSQVHPHAREVAQKCGLQSFTRLSRSDRIKLNELIEEEIPQLRSELYGRFGSAEARGPSPQPRVAEVRVAPADRADVLVPRRRAV